MIGSRFTSLNTSGITMRLPPGSLACAATTLSMRHARAQRQPITGAKRSARTTPIAPVAAANGTTEKPRRSAHSRRMGSVFMMCSAMSGSGWRTAITMTTTTRPRVPRRGQRMIAGAVSPAVVAGSPIPSCSAWPAAMDTPRSTGTACLVSGWLGTLTP
jgi:hypothetical protein